MNWKASAETDLRTYNFRRQSLDNIQERITALKATQDGLRAAAAINVIKFYLKERK